MCSFKTICKKFFTSIAMFMALFTIQTASAESNTVDTLQQPSTIAQTPGTKPSSSCAKHCNRLYSPRCDSPLPKDQALCLRLTASCTAVCR